MEGEKKHDVVRVLETFGRYHYIHWILVSLPAIVHTMSNINFVIVAGEMEYRCRIPECDTPESTHKYPPWWPTWNSTVNAKCSRPILAGTLVNGTCSNTSFTQEIGECSEWIYENNNSIVSEYNLACQPVKINMVGVIHNIGMLFSFLIFGWMSDRFGRKLSFMTCSTGVAIGLLKLASASYTMFGIVDFCEAFVAGGMYLSLSVMLIEFSTIKTRVYAGVIVASVVCVGEILLGVLALFFPYWKHLILLIYAPPLIFFCYIFIIKESPRWQVINGKIDEAKRNIESIANFNKISITARLMTAPQELKDIDEEKLKAVFNIKKTEVKDGFKEIFMSREIVIRLIVGAVCRFTSVFVYYGIVINSVNLPGDKNFNFFLSTLMTLPGELISMYLMNKVGRKTPLIFSYLLAGVMCVASGYITSEWGKVTAFLVGKMLIAVCFTGVGTYVMELYPTSTRGFLLSVGFCTSRLGALLAPLTPLLIPISPNLPPIIFGVMTVASSILLTQTPETKNTPLFETIAQVENYTKVVKEKKKEGKLNEGFVVTSEITNSDTVTTRY